jgi:hypothetical protein
MSWFDGLNDAMAVFADTPLTWRSGSTEINLTVITDTQYDEIARASMGVTSSEQEIFECKASLIAGMRRKDVVVMKGYEYEVVANKPPDSSGWSRVVIERIR